MTGYIRQKEVEKEILQRQLEHLEVDNLKEFKVLKELGDKLLSQKGKEILIKKELNVLKEKLRVLIQENDEFEVSKGQGHPQTSELGCTTETNAFTKIEIIRFKKEIGSKNAKLQEIKREIATSLQSKTNTDLRITEGLRQNDILTNDIRDITETIQQLTNTR